MVYSSVASINPNQRATRSILHRIAKQRVAESRKVITNQDRTKQNNNIRTFEGGSSTYCSTTTEESSLTTSEIDNNKRRIILRIYLKK